MIKIFTFNDLNPEFVELQVSSFRKYMREDFEFILINSIALGNAPQKAEEIERICSRLGVRTIQVERDSAIEDAWFKSGGYPDDPGVLFGRDGRYPREMGRGCNYIVQWMWEKIICKEKGPICLMHSDVLLTEPIKLTDYLVEHPICSVKHHPGTDLSIDHMWEALLLADIPRLPEPEEMVWFPSHVKGHWCDTGGPTYHWLVAHPEIKPMWIDVKDFEDDPDVDFHPARYQYFYLGGKRVLHYLSGSRWITDFKRNGCWDWTPKQIEEYHAKKMAWTKGLIGL